MHFLNFKYFHFLQSVSFTKLIVALIIIYPILFIWQCGDLTDTGFYATHYLFYFENLHANKINSLMFFTEFTGAVWVRYFISGIIGLKLLYLLLLYPILYFSYLILKEVVPSKNYLLIGLFTALAFSERFIYFVFNQEIFAWFFMIISAYFLIRGIRSVKIWLVFFSGTLFTLSWMARFPNIILFLFVPLILAYAIFYRNPGQLSERLRLFSKVFLAFIFGSAFSLAIFWILLKYQRLDALYISGLPFWGNHQPQSHYPGLLLKNYINDFLGFLPHLLVFSLVFYSFSLTADRFKKKSVLVFVAVLFFAVGIFIYFGFSYNPPLKYLVPAVCFTPLLVSIIRKDQYSYIAIILICFSLAQVAGTNTGLFLKLNYGLLILLPLSFYIIQSWSNYTHIQYLRSVKLPLYCTFLLILFLSTSCRAGTIYHVHKGVFARWVARYSLQNPKMKCIYTTNKNASLIDNLSADIKKNSKSGQYLLVYGHMPLFYYLAGMQPVVDNFWLVNDNFQGQQFFAYLTKSIHEKKNWPLIVDTKQRVYGDKGEDMLAEFLRDYNYKLVSSKSNYNIWTKN